MQLKFYVLAIMLICSQCWASPSYTNIEAEDFFSKNRSFAIYDDTFASNAAYIGVKNISKTMEQGKLLVELPFHEKGTFTIWVRARNLTLSLRSSNGINKTVKTTVKGKWSWVSAGTFSDKQVGAILEFYASKVDSGSGLDAVLISYNSDFQPSGIYNEFFSQDIAPSKPDRILKQKAANTETAKLIISTNKKIGEISNYVATACLDDAKRHLDGRKRFSTKGVSIVDNPRWDETMKTFFKDNMLILLFRPIRGKDGNYIRWDFESLDRYIERALKVWKCKELMFLPRWQIPSIRKNQAPTKAELDAGEEFFMQLVRRYGKKGESKVKYWAVADEWTLKRYWKNNSRDFIKYYSRLVRKAKTFNPELLIGGPVDAWPVTSIISDLLVECPELDFITWNMYISGNAQTPLDKLYQRTQYLEHSTIACRQISKRIRGKELPVIITAYGPNYRAWDPPDLKLAGPSNGVWQALAMSYIVKGGAFGAGSFNVMAKDYGLFGPRDLFALKGGFIPENIDDKTIYIRPSARVLRFFQKYIAGQHLCQATIVNQSRNQINYLAVNNANKGLAIVLVNCSPLDGEVEIAIEGYKPIAYKEFDLPVEYIYCDQDKILEGKGFIFSKQGTAKMTMPPFSAWLFYIKYAR